MLVAEVESGHVECALHFLGWQAVERWQLGFFVVGSEAYMQGDLAAFDEFGTGFDHASVIALLADGVAGEVFLIDQLFYQKPA